MSEPFVTVVIPTYNRASWLPQALESVCQQTYQRREVIVVDDGSTDNTEGVVKAFFGCEYIFQSNRGVSAARNVGVLKSRGDYIAFLDSDDRWQPTKLEEQVSLLKRKPDLRWCHTNESWLRNGQHLNQGKKHRKGGGDQFKRSLELCCISPSSVMLHRSLFDKYGFFDESMPACEDYDLWIRLTAHELIGYLEAPLVIKFGGHDDQLSHRFKAMDKFRVYALDKLLTHGGLRPDQCESVMVVLKKRLSVLINGAHKHGNLELLEALAPLIKRYEE